MARIIDPQKSIEEPPPQAHAENSPTVQAWSHALLCNRATRALRIPAPFPQQILRDAAVVAERGAFRPRSAARRQRKTDDSPEPRPRLTSPDRVGKRKQGSFSPMDGSLRGRESEPISVAAPPLCG